MYRYFLGIFIIISMFGCSEEVSNVDFKGLWIAKNYKPDSLASSKKNNTNFNFEAMYFKENGTDSVAFFLNQDSVYETFGFNKYDTYYLKFDESNEAFIVYDYTTHELLYRDIKRKKTSRFVKLDTTNNPAIYNRYKKIIP